jgi:hypothetical protein
MQTFNKEFMSNLLAFAALLIAGAAFLEASAINKASSASQFRASVLAYETELAKHAVSLSCWAHYAEAPEEVREHALRFTGDLKNRFNRSIAFEQYFQWSDPESDARAALRFASEQREATYGYLSALAELKNRVRAELRQEASFVCGNGG